jgi:hypothetical protein
VGKAVGRGEGGSTWGVEGGRETKQLRGRMRKRRTIMRRRRMWRQKVGKRASFEERE